MEVDCSKLVVEMRVVGQGHQGAVVGSGAAIGVTLHISINVGFGEVNFMLIGH